MAKKGSVLVIDDEEVMRDVLENLLSGEGYRVELAKTAAADARGVARLVRDLTLGRIDVSPLERLRPQLFVKGDDYGAGAIPESALLERWGGAVVVVPYVESRSTTRLIEEVRREL